MPKAIFLKDGKTAKKDEFSRNDPVYCFTNAKRGYVVRTVKHRNRLVYVVRFQVAAETSTKPARYEEINCFRDELDFQPTTQKSVA